MKVVNLHERRHREVVVFLEGLLVAARAGQIKGVAVVMKLGPDRHRACIAGDYERHPDQAMQGVFRMERYLRTDVDFRESC